MPSSTWKILNSIFGALLCSRVLFGLLGILSASILAQQSLLHSAQAQLSVRERINEELGQVREGRVSIDEFAELLIAESVQSAEVGPLVEGFKPPVDGLAESISLPLIKKLRSHIAQGKRSSVKNLHALSNIVLPLDWRAERSEIFSLVSAFTKLESLREVGDLQSLVNFKVLNQKPKNKRVLEKRKQQILAELAERSFDRADPFQALSEMAKLGRHAASNSLEEKTKKLIDKIAKLHKTNKLSLSAWTLDESSVQPLIEQVAKNDSEMRANLDYLYEQKLLLSIDEEEFTRSRLYYNRILANRPDPSAENDELRKKLVMIGSRKEKNSFIDARIEELKQSGLFSFSDTLMLYRNYYYGRALPYTLFGVFGASILGILMMVLGARIRLPSLSRASKNARYTNVVQEDDEYTRLLAQFGLNENATETQIKRAFRRAVKEHHPDAHGADGKVLDEDGEVDETFQEMRKTYNRILEIRSGWFGSR